MTIAWPIGRGSTNRHWPASTFFIQTHVMHEMVRAHGFWGRRRQPSRTDQALSADAIARHPIPSKPTATGQAHAHRYGLTMQQAGILFMGFDGVAKGMPEI